jgi:hypothetical protein
VQRIVIRDTSQTVDDGTTGKADERSTNHYAHRSLLEYPWFGLNSYGRQQWGILDNG